nr:MAG TPA: hypothetical protein [Caudoviricetes sp.]
MEVLCIVFLIRNLSMMRIQELYIIGYIVDICLHTITNMDSFVVMSMVKL